MVKLLVSRFWVLKGSLGMVSQDVDLRVKNAEPFSHAQQLGRNWRVFRKLTGAITKRCSLPRCFSLSCLPDSERRLLNCPVCNFYVPKHSMRCTWGTATWTLTRNLKDYWAVEFLNLGQVTLVKMNLSNLILLSVAKSWLLDSTCGCAPSSLSRL